MFSELKGVHSMPPCLSWSPDGKTIAFGSLDAESPLTTWEVGRPKIRDIAVGYVSYLAVLKLAWSPDGRTFAALGDVLFFDRSWP